VSVPFRVDWQRGGILPEEANLYDSLGEFLLRKGDKAQALEHYKKALEINPNFPNASAAHEAVKRLPPSWAGNRNQVVS